MSFSLSLTIKNLLKQAAEKVDASRIQGVLPVECMPPASLERIKTVPDDTARYALTPDIVQNGDTVKVTSTEKMYFVKDQTRLDTEDGYEEYSAGFATKARLAENSEKFGGLTLAEIREELGSKVREIIRPEENSTAEQVFDTTSEQTETRSVKLPGGLMVCRFSVQPNTSIWIDDILGIDPDTKFHEIIALDYKLLVQDRLKDNAWINSEGVGTIGFRAGDGKHIYILNSDRKTNTFLVMVR